MTLGSLGPRTTGALFDARTTPLQGVIQQKVEFALFASRASTSRG